MPLIPYPNIPKLPGVPALARSNNAQFAAGALNLVAQFLPDNLFGTTWSILEQKTGKKILEPDSVVTFENTETRKISNYPVEKGSFSSYNYIRIPASYKLVVTCSGNGKMTKSAFLKGIDQMLTGRYGDGQLVLVTISTPEYSQPNLKLIHTNNRREATKGATLLIYELMFEEVISIEAEKPNTTATPSGAPSQKFGQLSPTSSGSFGKLNPNSTGGFGLK